ncbi:MAG: YraN family protein [Anaerotruncus sp.]|nr:YraN family protein [Anaerotruncus sp.]
MVQTRKRGSQGEAFACARLQEAGYEILAQNYYAGHFEIDIIARRAEVIAFIEVKSRVQDGYEQPAEAVSRAQQKRIMLASVSYLKENGIYNTGEYQPRYDIFEVVTARTNALEVVHWSHLIGAYDTGGQDVFI